MSEESSTRAVALPSDLVKQIEELMQAKYEKRPFKVSTGAFISELIRSSLEKEQAQETYPQVLEEYSVDSQRVYIKDNQRDIVAELYFKDGSDLYCNYDSSKNCVHVGFAMSIPAVQQLQYERMKGN
jgi:hypothetical protein